MTEWTASSGHATPVPLSTAVARSPSSTRLPSRASHTHICMLLLIAHTHTHTTPVTTTIDTSHHTRRSNIDTHTTCMPYHITAYHGMSCRIMPCSRSCDVMSCHALIPRPVTPPTPSHTRSACSNQSMHTYYHHNTHTYTYTQQHYTQQPYHTHAHTYTHPLPSLAASMWPFSPRSPPFPSPSLTSISYILPRLYIDESFLIFLLITHRGC